MRARGTCGDVVGSETERVDARVTVTSCTRVPVGVSPPGSCHLSTRRSREAGGLALRLSSSVSLGVLGRRFIYNVVPEIFLNSESECAWGSFTGLEPVRTFFPTGKTPLMSRQSGANHCEITRKRSVLAWSGVCWQNSA